MLKKERVLREVHKPVWAVEDNAPIPGGPDFVLEVDHGLLPHAVRQRQGILHAAAAPAEKRRRRGDLPAPFIDSLTDGT